MLNYRAGYCFWLVLALLAGVADGYWLWRRRLTRFDWFNIWLPWAPLALAGGLVVAILSTPPRRTGLYVETFLLLSFGFIGCLLGAWLRDARSRVKLAPVEAADHARQAAARRGAYRTGAVAMVEQAPGVIEGRKEVEIGASGSQSQPAHIGQV
jgi:hypothetical protein